MIPSLCSPAYPTASTQLGPVGTLPLPSPLRFRFPHLQGCFSGGEALHPGTLASWRAQTGLDIREFYGQTETVPPGARSCPCPPPPPRST